MAKMDNRIETNKLIHDAPICKHCPARIYQKDNDKIKYGKGSLFPNVIFVLPSEAINNRHVENYLIEVTKEFVDINFEYVTYHPKCTASSPVEGYGAYCKQYLIYEIKKFNPKKIIFFGVDIPEEIIKLSNTIKIYKLHNLLSIYYGRVRLNDFINVLKDIL